MVSFPILVVTFNKPSTWAQKLHLKISLSQEKLISSICRGNDPHLFDVKWKAFSRFVKKNLFSNKDYKRQTVRSQDDGIILNKQINKHMQHTFDDNLLVNSNAWYLKWFSIFPKNGFIQSLKSQTPCIIRHSGLALQEFWILSIRSKAK